MLKELEFWNEETIRAKVITKWLLGHGFSLSDLYLEFSFFVQLGRTRLAVCDGQVERIRSDEILFQRKPTSTDRALMSSFVMARAETY